ncbi:MAG: YggS family pyridoxal phosphate-dependent enzyme [Elusimicrobia bacterium]|nr:YggS family pyridoxal phosphate-dependent enzyme [Elusimicrobiota bacterium]
MLENLHGVLTRIERAAGRAGRDPAEVELVAVTKKARPEAVLELLGSGLVSHVGENRVQDAAAKRKALEERGSKAVWHMLGHLQRNKSRQALETFETVDSLDSLPLAERLDGDLAETGKTLPVLVQVKLTERETQSGLAPEALGEFLEKARKYERLKVRGLMAIAPNLDPVEAVRPHFRRMREIFERNFPEGGTLSMGMSRDFEIAVEEGANMVRVGSALFN